MYNFLDSKLKPHATSSCPSTDGYEATNLISDDFSLKSKGFLAYSAIKPPVDIDFNFICPINIHCIIIWNSVGSLKTIGFELLLKNTTFDFTIVAKVYSKESDGVAIFNRIHSTSTKFHVPQHFPKDFFKTNHLKILTCADKLKMRIFRTQSGAPCIGKIEVWGEISRTCTQTTMDTIKYLMSKTNHNESIKTLNVPSCSTTSKKTKLKDDFNIPEDFIDPITFQIMSLPITLPSGKTIDQSTLEKHKESEAKWGRNLSDPFTGQIFTSLRKPALNSALKNRIDAFLLENANAKETFNIQRTVGRRKPENTIAVIENPKTENTIETNQSQTNVSDLDEAIKNALSNNMLVRFTLDNDSKNEPDNKVCGFCDMDSNLYILICEHYICRHCLLSNAAVNRCKICNNTFSRSDIKKFHN